MVQRAQVVAHVQIAAAVQAINNLATAQVRKDTPSLIDLNVLGRPKEFSGKEEDFQQWSKKTEAFFAGVIKDQGTMLEWAVEQKERGVQNLEFVLQQTHTALLALTRCEANDIVAISRKNPLEAWRRLQRRYDLTTGGRKRNFHRAIVSPGCCSLLELQERSESVVSRYEKKLKNKMDDEIKLAGLEALVPEELEKHLILNSNRRRTFEGARLEIVTYVEPKFGLRIRDSKPSDTGLCEHSDVGAVNFFSSVEGKGSSVPRVGCFKIAMEHIYNESAMQARTLTSNRQAKAIKASHGPRVSPQPQAKKIIKRTMENPKGSPKEPKFPSKVPKAEATVKH